VEERPIPDWYSEEVREEIRRLRAKMPKTKPGSKEAILACAGLWAGAPEELEQLTEMVMQEREWSLQC
jgi:hypothetical protein